jgi:hypothetical protein
MTEGDEHRPEPPDDGVHGVFATRRRRLVVIIVVTAVALGVWFSYSELAGRDREKRVDAVVEQIHQRWPDLDPAAIREALTRWGAALWAGEGDEMDPVSGLPPLRGAEVSGAGGSPDVPGSFWVLVQTEPRWSGSSCFTVTVAPASGGTGASVEVGPARSC